MDFVKTSIFVWFFKFATTNPIRVRSNTARKMPNHSVISILPISDGQQSIKSRLTSQETNQKLTMSYLVPFTLELYVVKHVS